MPTDIPSLFPTSPVVELVIQLDQSGYCISLPSSNTSDGVKIILSQCNGQENQLWYIESLGLIPSSLNSDKCIQVEGSSFTGGETIEIQACNDDNVTQQWEMVSTGEIRSHSGNENSTHYCMDGNDFGEPIVVWQCDETPDQYWTWISMANSTSPQ